MTAYDDRTLLEYLNGASSPEVASEIEAALTSDTMLEHRLMELDPYAQVVRDTFASLPGDEPISPDLDSNRFGWRTRYVSNRSRKVASLVVLAIFVFGLIVYWSTR